MMDNDIVSSLWQHKAVYKKRIWLNESYGRWCGELDAIDLRNNSLDPRNRILIRLTMDDIERELAQFNILHGDASDERKLMMQHFKLGRDDLDN